MSTATDDDEHAVDAGRTTTAAPVIRITDLCRSHGAGETVVHALARARLDIPRGRFVGLLGPSGSGKTTLLDMIGAIDEPSSGAIVVDGVDLHDLRGGTHGDRAATAGDRRDRGRRALRPSPPKPTRAEGDCDTTLPQRDDSGAQREFGRMPPRAA